jgi:hypothetical protein
VVIVDPELKDFAKAGGSARRSVILETITNPVAAPTRLQTVKSPKAKRAPSLEPIDESASFEALGRELEGLGLAEAPVRMEGIRSFVVELTPEQVRRVLELPMVAAVRLNRTHQVPRNARR